MPAKIKLAQEVHEELVKDYKSGLSLRKLETKYGRNRRVLSKILKETGVDIRDNTQNSRKYYHNENYFEIIDTEPKAYWLGFLYADGFLDCQNNTGITLSIKDIEHLEKFKSCIEASNPINVYKGSGYVSENEFARILLKSKKMKQDLINKGMLEHKTLDLIFPNNKQVPSGLIRHFVRGYFDGDGSIWSESLKDVYRIGFTGTEDMLIDIRTFLNNQSVIKRKGNAYQLNIGGNRQVLRIMHLLYDDATIFLDRKRDKFEKLQLKYSES